MKSISAYSTLPVSETPESAPTSWTQETRQQAFNRAVQDHGIAYFGQALKQRNWSPWHDLPLEEMRERGHQLSEDTHNLVEGFLGVEEHVGDYVQAGVEIFRDDRTRRNIHLQWGAEETRHGVAWELVLEHSHARTETQIAKYLEEGRASRWNQKQHPGVETPLGTTAYAMVQERATFFHYQEMRARIREEYGLPRNPIPEERQRGYEIGASEAFRLVAQDELAHHILFLQIVRSALKYFPEETFAALGQVFTSFEMPILRFLPNTRAFLRSIKRTGFYSSGIHQEKIHTPVLNALGLDDQQAFNRAGQRVHTLPDDVSPDCIKLSRTGEWKIAPAQDSVNA